MNPRLDQLHAYPFERLRRLLADVKPPEGVKPINLGIGEPQHPTPALITDALTANLDALGKYPPTAGHPALRNAIADWHVRRYGIPRLNDETEIIPVAGTREALFGFAQAVLDPSDPGVVLLPNPFYQIYEGAAIMAGAEPFYVPTPAETGFLPDWSAVPEDVWPRVKLAYVCSPGNPAGAVLSLSDWQRVFDLADRFGFVIAADECYSEIYTSTPPVGALEAATQLGRTYERLVSFNSLSKRSSAPGLRSGFVAGDADLLTKYLLYRTYHGAAPSLLTQLASVEAWRDEAHVVTSREMYQEKFRLAAELLPVAPIPAGGFFLWLPVEDDEGTCQRLFETRGLTVLPGRYLGRDNPGNNPGTNFLRVALVPSQHLCTLALEVMAEALQPVG